MNPKTGKGKHSTTGSRLFVDKRGSQWIDTPGIKEFRLVGVNPDEVKESFTEIDWEAEADLLEQEPRYESYLRIMDSLAEEDASS